MSEGVGENPDNKGGQCLGTVGKGQMPQRGQAGYTQEHSGAHLGQRSGGVEARASPHGFRQRVGGEEADTKCLPPPVSRALVVKEKERSDESNTQA